MKLYSQTPKQSLNKAFLKQPVNRDDIDSFKTNLQVLLGKINENESEEHHKNFVRDFLKDTFYKSDYEINTKGRQDLVIHIGKNASDKVGVILETKKPTNKADMISAENPNKKALHELVLYFLRERIDENNIDIKYLIVTNINEWFIFDASVFNRLFYENKAFVKEYTEWRDKLKITGNTPLFYKDIVKPYIESIDEIIPCTRFDIRDYETELNNSDLKDDKSLIELFKILSPNHLLKVPFADDSNKLDKNFYTELLHIIGLEEIKEKSKLRIDRKAESKRDAGSLIENTIAIIETKDCLYKVKNLESYGNTKEERLFGVALELCLTWINRVLFLKLLEAQLLDYHDGNRDFRFLDISTIQDFDELFTLFHQVLAKMPEDRREIIKEKYNRVPYLNSSLFEISELESETITIESLKDTIQLPFISSSILKGSRNGRNSLPTLVYLFRFLDAYDFASEGAEGITENNRSLINASVLGKVFEKINGYKDGSIYTPGFITMYMCRQAIRLAVVQKFKDAYGWNISEFTDIKNYLADYRGAEKIKEFNALINSLHLCDPAVGSGHFLVSSLNEIIAIKSELGILSDENGERFRDVEITIENDELTVFDTDRNEFFKYRITNGKPQSKEAQRLQRTLFHEKQMLIENCLFGVDINPNSVKICRLRLWIELLKNAYYKESSSYAELETLPNIDINIKEGNSLISRFTLDEDLTQVLKKVEYSIEDYRNFVLQYKETRDREKKRDFENKIKQIKADFKKQLFFFSPERRELADLENQLKASESKQFLFGETDEENTTRVVKEAKLKIKIEQKKSAIKQIEENAIYKNAFEWRFEFPEVLDNEGNFLGFDIVIGNPPYIPLESIAENYRELFRNKYNQVERKYDTSVLFILEGLNLLKPERVLSYIAPITWQTGENYSKFREFIISEYGIDYIINLPFNTFENAYVETSIYSLVKFKLDNYRIYNFDKKDTNERLEKVDFTQISISKITRPNYKIVLDLTVSNLLNKFQNDKFVSLGSITRSTQGLSPSRFPKTSKNGENIFPFLKKGNVYNYQLQIEETYMTDLSDKASLIGFYQAEEKILIRRIVNRQDRLSVGFTKESLVFKKDINPFVPTDENFSAKFLLGIIASKFISFLYVKSSNIATKDDFRQTTLTELRNLPIPIIGKKDQQPLIALVDQILELKKEGKEDEAKELENEIDLLVYQLYDLKPDEIKIIKGNKV